MTADEWSPPTEKRCDATKAKVPRSRSDSSKDGMTARQTLTAISKESADARRLYNCCTRREASAPTQVDASTDPWQVSQGMVKGGVQQDHIFTNASRGREVLKWALPPKTRRQDGRTLIRA